MNPRTERFIDGYVKTGNATRAYIDAGFAERGAGQAAHKLLRRAEVQAAVTARMRAAADAADVDTAQIVAAAVAIVVATGGDADAQDGNRQRASAEVPEQHPPAERLGPGGR